MQVAYNIFDQSPQDELIPFCREMGVGVIAQVPFDEDALTGLLTRTTVWPDGDWRNSYDVTENIILREERAESIKKLLPENMSLPALVLKFILHNPGISTMIPGMRKVKHVRVNIAVCDMPDLLEELLQTLNTPRLEREPTWKSK